MIGSLEAATDISLEGLRPQQEIQVKESSSFFANMQLKAFND